MHTATGVLVLFLAAASPSTQQSGPAGKAVDVEQAAIVRAKPKTLREAARSFRFETVRPVNPARPVPVNSRASLSRTKRGLLTAAAGFGGFFAGGYLGAAIEGDRCNCDDPGLTGFLIGAPLGAALAASVTWVTTR